MDGIWKSFCLLAFTTTTLWAEHSDTAGSRPFGRPKPTLSPSQRLLQLIDACSTLRPFPPLEFRRDLLPEVPPTRPSEPYEAPRGVRRDVIPVIPSPRPSAAPSSIPSPRPSPIPSATPRPVTTMHEFFSSKCMSCHPADSPSQRMRLFSSDGTPLENRKRAILNAFQGHIGSSRMLEIMEGIKRGLSSEEHTLLETWIRENQGTPTPSPTPSSTPLPHVSPSPTVSPRALDTRFGATPPAGEESVPAELKQLTSTFTPQALAEKVRANTAPLILYIGDAENAGHTQKIRGANQIGPLTQNDPAKLAQSIRKLEELEQRLGAGIKDQEIVIYCGCCPLAHCDYTWNAAWILARRGYTKMKLIDFKGEALDLQSGWIKPGYPVEPLR